MTRIVILAGPTASGKSGLALDLASGLGGEIVNADSVQVYRGFDIGSAKPSPADRSRVPHHLIDTREPDEAWTAADFVRDADAAIEAVAARGRVPFVVGGTGLYLRSLLHGLAEGPPAQPELRAALEADADRDGLGSLHDRLAGLDPVAAAAIHRNDRVRIVRALEVVLSTGVRRSDQHQNHGLREERYDAAFLVLTGPRATLHARIDARTAAMVQSGLLREVHDLLARGVPRTASPFRAIGYRHALERIDGTLREDDWQQTLARDTRHYARRQLVWFRRQRGIRWVPLDGGPERTGLRAALDTFLEGHPFVGGFATEAGAGADAAD